MSITPLVCAALALAAPDRPALPNIVLVVADDLGWSDLGCYGGEIPTPHLDSLAANGLRFRQFYTNAVCGPTRASILTGLHCQRIGHHGRHWNQPTDFTKSVTLGEMLQTAGYRTLMVGKWQERDLPARRGFDRFFGPMCQGKISYFNEVQANPFYRNEDRWPVPKQFSMTDALTEHAVRFVNEATTRASDRKPFFLYLAYVAPHWPLHAPEAEIAPHRERYRSGWDTIRDARIARQRKLDLLPEKWTPHPWPQDVHRSKMERYPDWQAERMAVYAAQVASIDRGVGQVLDQVRESGDWDNTLILFISDNGAAPDGGVVPTTTGFGFGPGKRNDDWRIDRVPIRPGSGPETMPGPADTFAGYGHGWATVSNTPFRNTKMTAYEGGIRSPYIAHWPKVISKGGRISEQVGHVVDLMATFLDITGTTYPKTFADRTPLPLDGLSLLPTFRGKDGPEHRELFWNAPKNQAMRSGQYKLVNAAPGKPWELYDLATDATETRNLAKRHPDTVLDLAARWNAWARDVDVDVPKAP